MIHAIRLPTPVREPVDLPRIQPPEPPLLQDKFAWKHRILIQFNENVPLPDDDEIVCSVDGLAGIFPEQLQLRLSLSPVTACLRRLFPKHLAEKLEHKARQVPHPAEEWMAMSSFQRYYCLSLTDCNSVEEVTSALEFSGLVILAYPEPTLVTHCTSQAIPAEQLKHYRQGYPARHWNPTLNQSHLEAGPVGINAKEAWDNRIFGQGITVGFAEPGAVFQNDLKVRTVFDSFILGMNSGGEKKRYLDQGQSSDIPNSFHAIGVAGLLNSPPSSVGRYGPMGICHISDLHFSDTRPIVDNQGTVRSRSHHAVAQLLGSLPAGSIATFSFGIHLTDSSLARIYDEQLLGKLNKSFAAYPFDPPFYHPSSRVVPKDENRSVSYKGWALVPNSATYPVSLHMDPIYRQLFHLAVKLGVTVCHSAGNGFYAEFTRRKGTNPVTLSTDLGSSTDQLGVLAPDMTNRLQVLPTSLDRLSPGEFIDSGVIVVGGGSINSLATPRQSNPRTDFTVYGNRVDCYAQAQRVIGTLGPEDDDFRGYTGTYGQNKGLNDPPVGFGGSSAATPIVAGAAALVQCYVKQRYGTTLSPLFLRSLLSDPSLGTLCDQGSEIGSMPDLGKIINCLKQGQVNQWQTLLPSIANHVKTSFPTATPQQPQHPYRILKDGSWVPMPIDKTIFNPD